MINWLVQLDIELFLTLNGLHHPILDKIMWLMSQTWFWIPVYLMVLGYLWVKNKIPYWVIGAAFTVLLVLTDQSSVWIKKTVQRPRPTYHAYTLQWTHTVINPRTGRTYLGGRFGFVSSHAANTFGFAMLSSLLIKRWLFTCCLLGWATVISYSRIYLGVHFPADIIGGALLGIFWATLIYGVMRIYSKRIPRLPIPGTTF